MRQVSTITMIARCTFSRPILNRVDASEGLSYYEMFFCRMTALGQGWLLKSAEPSV
jgi:hypothetical protein